MAQGALHDVVVLEIAGGVAGPYVGRLAADFGAQVIKVEPPGGDWLRDEPPLVGAESAFFNYLNAGKLGLELDATDPRIDHLAAHADIIVHDLRGPAADALDARLMAANPAAVVLSITPYGRRGERAGWETSELTEWATSGYGYIAGHPEKPPLGLGGHQAGFHAGLHGAIAALAGLWQSRNSGEGQRVEISRQEATLNDHAWLTTLWTHQGAIQKRTGSIFAPCADGFVFLFHLVPYSNLFLLMERYDLLEDESLLVPQNWWARFPEILAALSEWATTRTKQEIYHAAQELRIAVSPVNDMADVALNPQLLARDWFGSVRVGGAEVQAPGFPYQMTGTPCEQPGPAPKLGEHQQTVLAPGFGWANAAVPAPIGAPANGAGPLTGLRVLEVTANWAGPIGGRHLGDLGADVIKIELATKPATRGLATVADDLVWPQHYNRSGYFNKLNRNKRVLTLNLASPEGRDLFLKLVEGADAVIENNAARVMTNLGVGYESLRAVNPGIVMCSMSGYGATGPDRNYSAYGSNIEAASGLASVLGYGPDDFYGTGTFYADPVTGNHGSVAVLAALHARRASGLGQWVDMSLLEAVTPFFAQPFLEYTTTRRVPRPMANRSPLYAPQGVYRTLGDDCWLALTVRDDQEWHALCKVMEREDLLWDGSCADLAGRQANHDRIDEAVAAWALTTDHNHAAESLQAAGIAAAPVMANWEIVSDNHLNSRDYFVRIAHPEAGTHWWPGFAWRFERTPATIRRPAPMFGEHNREILQGVLGLGDAAIAALYEAGVTGDAPIYG